MTLSQEQISKTFKLMQERSEAPRLTPEQLNAIDLLILTFFGAVGFYDFLIKTFVKQIGGDNDSEDNTSTR